MTDARKLESRWYYSSFENVYSFTDLWNYFSFQYKFLIWLKKQWQEFEILHLGYVTINDSENSSRVVLYRKKIKKPGMMKLWSCLKMVEENVKYVVQWSYGWK